MVKKINPIHHKESLLEKLSVDVTHWIGTPQSVIVHTLIFIGFAAALSLGADFNHVILIWNTLVSLEAIYLALFIQMTVNRQSQSIEDIEEDIEDIQEDVEELSDDVEDISEDIDEYHTEEDEGQIKRLVKKGISELRSKHII